ncbi:hypothetical protein CRM22_010158 [Opisthorchis felineus]|uniref:Nucleoporin NDC1 n=1 Tax=Opisthorchis felineus TaxID=147828 RepID=A0A4V6RGQ3_OPIFE|nr:hypothetical protein CRM22_010158 [Opisthorchis felineus]
MRDYFNFSEEFIMAPYDGSWRFMILVSFAGAFSFTAFHQQLMFNVGRSAGGRPLLWRQISSWSTSVIEQFVTKVHRANADVMSKTTSMTMPPFEVKYQDHLPASFRTQIRQRLGIVSAVQLTPKDALSSTDARPSLMDSLARREFGEAANILCVRVSKVASKLPLLQSLKADIPYAITADLFAGSLEDVSTSTQVYTGGQSLIWAIEILACLTLASYTEDTYGSVQRSLGRILSLFADGLEVVERHLRLVGLLTKDVGSTVYPIPEDGLSNSPGLSGELPASDSPVSARLTPYTNPVAACKAEDICNLSYYRLASDPTLPWRVYATLTWAATNCLRQFGDHLENCRERLHSD